MSDLMITEGDVESFRRKLDSWGATLSDAEQAILQMISVRAFPDGPGPEVEGFMHDLPFVKTHDRSTPGLAVAFGAGTIESFVGMSVRVATMPTMPPGPPV